MTMHFHGTGPSRFRIPIKITRAMRAAIAIAVLAALCGLSRSEARPIREVASPAATIDQFIGRLQLGTPRQRGALTIVPIRCSDATSGVETLSEALKGNTLGVHEIGEGRVNQLEIENTGKIPVFVMAGQILVGAKQNRVLQHDLLLPPMSGRVTVEAFCVQHGRWSYENDKQKTFSRSDNFSNPQVRQAATVAKAQSEVWAKVDETRRAAGPAAAGRDTSDLNGLYEDKSTRTRIAQQQEAFSDLPQAVPDMQGAVVLLDGRVVALDVFGDRAVFRRLWRPLLASYVLEGSRSGKGDIDVGTHAARAFLQAARQGDVRRLATPGSGVLVELIASQVRGDALIGAHSVMHLGLFPGGHVTKGGDSEEPAIIRPQR